MILNLTLVGSFIVDNMKIKVLYMTFNIEELSISKEHSQVKPC